MILPEIVIEKKVSVNSFYFAADTVYFENFGKPLALSLKEHASWSNVHAHLFNPTQEQIKWCNKNNITVSYETVDPTINEINTYYACVRFIRVPQIFEKTARIISLDCDGVVVRPIAEEKFLEDTKHSAALWRNKGQTSLASSLFFGVDNFRNKFAEKLIPHFKNDSFKWYLDQEVLDIMIKNKEVEIVELRDWGNPKVNTNTLIWTAKGNRKTDPGFQAELNKYKDHGLT
jgi:hypothetical protein